MSEEHKEGLDALSNETVEELHDLVAETDEAALDSDEQEVEENKVREEEKREAISNEEALLYETANTWAVVRTPK